MKKTYEFNNPSDMIELAQFVQTKIYWGTSFYIGEDEESVGYNNFWDYMVDPVSAGAKAVVIEDGKYVTFIK